MSLAYRAIQWNAHKRAYDLLLLLGVAAFVLLFVLVSKLTHRHDHAPSDEVLLLRATAVAAYLLLHLILCIGPLCRLDRRFLPLLYNRRHMGVTMFLLALLHALLAVGYYHGFGVISPLHSLLVSNTQYRSISAFPFETLGLIALLILFLMAATSHDFWLKNLTPRLWKSLHMGVYFAWALLVMHVALGVLQSERHPLFVALVVVGVAVVAVLHIAAGRKQTTRQTCREADIPESRAVALDTPAGRVAVYKHQGKLFALSNTCAHQGGPISEGKIVGGCVTCPWHGYQYQPHDGCSPPPFTEKIATHPVRVVAGQVVVDVEAPS